jgi:hypothetical protein
VSPPARERAVEEAGPLDPAVAPATPETAPAADVPTVQRAVAAPGLGLGQQQALAAHSRGALGNAALSRLVAPGRMLARLTKDEASKQIMDAGSGLGTDEDAMFEAIRQCADRAALKADAAVIAELDDELSGTERWHATLLLELGPESAWPPAAREIFAAVEGIGTDEARIFRALSVLSDADAQAIGRIPGLNAMLDDELSGEDLQAARDLLSGSYARAIAYHQANVAMMLTEVNGWRAGTDVLLKNTAEWILPTTGGSPRNNVYVMSPTHDAAARATAAGHRGSQAYFGGDKLFPDASATYGAVIGDTAHMMFPQATVAGEHQERNIWVYDPQHHGAAVVRDWIVAHEVQHDADRHDTEEGYTASYKSPEESWNRYKTEFRSYYVTGAFDPATNSTAPGSAPAPWDNAKQKAIFDHMYTGVYAEWLKPNYDGDTAVDGETDHFQALVHGYKQPEGVNLTNSPRVDELFLSLQRCSPGDTDLTAAPLSTLMANARALNADDLAAVNAASAARLQDELENRLDRSALGAVALVLGGGTVPAWAVVNLGPARRAILAAGAGWGTDEDAMYAAIANATDAERAEMRTDKVIQNVLRDELSGDDLARAQRYLQYGPKSNWPPEVVQQDGG